MIVETVTARCFFSSAAIPARRHQERTRECIRLAFGIFKRFVSLPTPMECPLLVMGHQCQPDQLIRMENAVASFVAHKITCSRVPFSSQWYVWADARIRSTFFLLS